MKKQQILKYELSRMHGQEFLYLPAGAQVLSVANQRDSVMVWALCDPTAPLTQYLFTKEYTGIDIVQPDLGNFLGTVLLYDSSLVVHVFYRIPEPAIKRITWSGVGTFCPATHTS